MNHIDFPCFEVDEFERYFWQMEREHRAYPCFDCSLEYQSRMIREGRCRHPRTVFDEEGHGVIAPLYRNRAYARHLSEC